MARDAAARPRLEKEEEEEGDLPPLRGHTGLLHLPAHQLSSTGPGTQLPGTEGTWAQASAVVGQWLGTRHTWGIPCLRWGWLSL